MGSSGSNLQSVTLLAAFCFLATAIAEGSEVSAAIGGAVELECSLPAPELESSASHVVEWVRQGLDIPVLMKFGPHPPRVHPKYEGRVSLVENTNLRLEGLQLGDQGLYQCLILLLDKSTDEPQNSTWTRLSVTAPPSFTRAPPLVIEGLVGSDLSLECEAAGNPQPAISWSKDGSVIEGSRFQDGVLLLQAVNMQSAGQYICQASNSEGSTTVATKVKIKGPPVIIVPPKNTSLNMSQNALLQCQAVADPPNMTYVWQRERENVYHRESLKSRVKILVDGTLLISRLTPEDSGNYTCMPTNGLLTPPTASAVLTVMHPARASGMPKETYLPTGMDGRVHCPAVAQPPLLRVVWTKDGEPLDLSMYPGWSVTSTGSLIMATVNEDAEGVYTCTPYNSYGSMGPSGATKVILQDPPYFRTAPKKEYREETGRTLLIPCQGNEDPTTKIIWTKVDVNRPISYSIEPNGSLLLQPLMKEHHGLWECSAANRVASVKSATQILVLGTSPHAATSLSVSPGLRQANISWESGFDGGSAQTFSVWVKKISESGNNDEKQDWFSVAVPSLQTTRLLVTGLSPSTLYQFSVLSHNRMGTGPFSEIASVRTLDNSPKTIRLKPPVLLTATMSAAGVVLQWSPPPAQHPPLTGFLLQSRTNQGEWFNVDEDISANSSEIIVPGLHKDSVYELRLLSRCGELLSEPGPSVNVSTVGIETYPSTSRLLEFVPEPLLAGVLGGVGFMCLALVLLLGSACIISHKRDRRRKKRDDTPRVIYKSSPSMKTSGFGSADSVLKKNLLPASPLYPTISSTTSSSTSSKTDCSSFSTEDCHQRKNQLGRGCLSRTSSSPLSPSVEMISRGSDGRFVLPPYEDKLSIHRTNNLSANVKRSISVSSECQGQKDAPFVLSVDLPPCKSSHVDQISTHLSYCCPDSLEQKEDDTDIYSMRSSLSSFPQKVPEFAPSFPVLPHIRSGFGQPSKTASALVLQMEHERETGNLSRCLKLAEEREELERELQRLQLHRGSEREINEEAELEEDEVRRPVWEYKSSTLPQRHQPCTNEILFSSPSVPWDASAHVSSPSVIPVRTSLSISTSSPTRVHPGKHQHAPAFIKQAPLRSEEAHSFSKDTLTLPRVSSKHQRHESEEAVSHHNSQQSTSSEMQTSDSYAEVRRRNYPRADSNLALFFHHNQSMERAESAVDTVSGYVQGDMPEQNNEVFVEMSVDEPEFYQMQPNEHMLHHRIASHVRHGHPLTSGDNFKDLKRSKSCVTHGSASVDYSLKGSVDVRRAVSGVYDSKRRSQSLDLRRKKRGHFLTPDAWIDSLNQHYGRSLRHVDYLESQRYATLNSPSNTKAIHEDNQSSVSNMERPTQIREVCSYQPLKEAFIVPNPAKSGLQENMKKVICYLEDTKESSRCVLEDNVFNTEQKALRVEEGGYRDVAGSGSSYSSYASSGRGSMAPTSGRLSTCNLPPSSTSSPVTVEESQQSTEDKYRHQMEQSQRKLSVDENYEWDATDFSPQTKDAKDGLLPLLNLHKSALCSSLPSVSFSTKALENCSRFSFLPGHQSRRSAEPEQDTVLF